LQECTINRYAVSGANAAGQNNASLFVEKPTMPMDPQHGQEKNAADGLCSLADELKRESERLRQLAEKLKAREDADAEMRANYPYFKEFVYAKLREEFKDDLDPIPDNDLEAYAKAQGALPIDDLLQELERAHEGS
jgi:hypothetical protein